MKPLCLWPFIHLEIAESGNVLCCCWGKYRPLGDLKKRTISSVWNGPEFQKLRERIYKNQLDKICDEKICHAILSGRNFDEKELRRIKLPIKFIEEIRAEKTVLSSGPFKITFSDIGTCNLKCKMCYRYLIKEDEAFSQKVIKGRLLEFLEENTRRRLIIKLTGNGDPFFRRETREFLQSFDVQKYPNVSFEILTNGLLLTPKMWGTIKHNHIEEINVSVDAATKPTYGEIRRGGNWEVLMKNLEFISKLRQKGKIGYFYINMVVMRSNYGEMEDFVKLGKRLNCDEVNFQRITGLHNLEENINDFPDNKIVHEICLKLNKPIFKSSKNFFVNTLQLNDYSRQRSRAEQIIGKIKLNYERGK